VAFGVTSSPFLVGAIIDLHLKKYSEGSGQTSEYTRDIPQILRTSFYIENCVNSVENEKQLHLYIKEACLVFAKAKFDLRVWEYSDSSLVNPTNTWDRKADNIAVSNLELMGVEVVTRGTMLSLAQRVFDPIGFICPISLRPKLLLQKCWKVKGVWDQEVPEDAKNDFLLWLREIPLLEEIRILSWLRVLPAFQVQVLIWTGDSGSNPERAPFK
jgi:hypothetical protein